MSDFFSQKMQYLARMAVRVTSYSRRSYSGFFFKLKSIYMNNSVSSELNVIFHAKRLRVKIFERHVPIFYEQERKLKLRESFFFNLIRNNSH